MCTEECATGKCGVCGVCLRIAGICHCPECAAAYWSDPSPHEQQAADALKVLGCDATQPHYDGSMGGAIHIVLYLEADDPREHSVGWYGDTRGHNEVRRDLLRQVDPDLREWCREFLELEVHHSVREPETLVADVRGFPCAWGAAHLLNAIDRALSRAHLPPIYAQRLLAAGE